MDRIRKALDLARLERAKAEPPLRRERAASGAPEKPLKFTAVPVEAFEERAKASAEATASVEAAEAAASAEQAAAAPPLTSIVYSRTRVFAPLAAHLERNCIMNPAATGGPAAAYRMLRTQVLQRLETRGWRSIAMFSPGAEDGKTTTAINLAVSLGIDRLHTALLVDFDFKRPTLASRFGLTPEFGVDDVLSGRAKLEDCLYHPEGYDRLVLLPARAGLDNSSEILSGPRNRELVAELRNRYKDRIILFDLPPVLSADDALSFAPLVECGLVVAAEGSTRRNDLLRTIELLHKIPLVGTVLNRAADAPSGY
ncbi:MAG: CpsD/CapB family tyrosine-protein kinase [Steroidobacteraceae bacterium]